MVDPGRRRRPDRDHLLLRKRLRGFQRLQVRLHSPGYAEVRIVRPGKRARGTADAVVRMPSEVAPPHELITDPVRYDPSPGASVTAVLGLVVVTDGVLDLVDGALRVQKASELCLRPSGRGPRRSSARVRRVGPTSRNGRRRSWVGISAVRRDPLRHWADRGLSFRRRRPPSRVRGEDHRRAAELVTAYADLPLGTTDATWSRWPNAWAYRRSQPGSAPFTVVRPQHVPVLTPLP